jgi:hypothetical protein
MDLTQLVIASLAVYRVSHLIAFEDGPGDLILRIRKRAGNGWRGKLMDCPYCLSIWVSFPTAILFSKTINQFLVNWLALSGAVVVIEKLTGRNDHGKNST